METSHAQGTARNTIPNDVLLALDEVLETARSARSFGQITQSVIVGLRVLGLLLVRTVLKERDRQHRQGPGRCPECGGTSRREKKLREKVRRTLWGKLRYKRCFHKCTECGHRFSPLELSLALLPALRGHCEYFAKHVVLLCTLMPFERGSDLFEEFFGHAVSTTLRVP